MKLNFAMKKIIFLSLTLASLPLLNGCLLLVAGGAAAAGAGTVIYVNGELKDTKDASLERVRAGTVAGLKDLKFAIVNDTADALSAKILARTSDDTKIQVTLTKQSPTLTEIRIRVGTFGDEQMSRQILDKIKTHL